MIFSPCAIPLKTTRVIIFTLQLGKGGPHPFGTVYKCVAELKISRERAQSHREIYHAHRQILNTSAAPWKLPHSVKYHPPAIRSITIDVFRSRRRRGKELILTFPFILPMDHALPAKMHGLLHVRRKQCQLHNKSS